MKSENNGGEKILKYSWIADDEGLRSCGEIEDEI